MLSTVNAGAKALQSLASRSVISGTYCTSPGHASPPRSPLPSKCLSETFLRLEIEVLMLYLSNSPSQSTIGLWKAGLPVRSVILKPHADELVAKLVTICESSLSIVFCFAFFLFNRKSLWKLDFCQKASLDTIFSRLEGSYHAGGRIRRRLSHPIFDLCVEP